VNRRRSLITAATVISLIAVTMAAFTGLRRSRPKVQTMVVESHPFRVRVTAEGNLTAVQSTPLTAPMTPRVPFTVAWMVDDGALVDGGDIIARFDASQLEKDREDGLSDQRISDQKIGSARTNREVSIANLDLDAEVAQRELEVAREFQSTDNSVYSRMEIIQSQIDTELAETRADHARESQEIQDHLSEAEIELLAIERRKADIKVQQADEGLAALEVRAPHSGIVMLERDWRGNPVRVGDTVWPGRPLARIPDLAEMQAEVFVLEADAGDLEAGQIATVWLESDPSTEHRATVKSIDPMAGRRNRRVPVQYFRTVLEIEATDTGTMKPGSRVRSEIVIADLESAIMIPRQAVTTVDGRSVVYRLDRGGFEAVEVELGLTALGRVVVVAGLETGDVIALSDPTSSGDEADMGGASPSSPILPGGLQ
jgi:HlyD family secretion protein